MTAAAVRRIGRYRRTASGGTEGFRPPEQRGAPSRVDARADLWALSALLVWLVTGHPPGDRPVRATLASVGFPRPFGDVLTTSLAEAVTPLDDGRVVSARVEVVHDLRVVGG